MKPGLIDSLFCGLSAPFIILDPWHLFLPVVEAFENLRSMAEIAVSLTGFTGIVVALGRRSHGAWTKLELLRLKMLLVTSLAVLFLSLLPLALSGLNFNELKIWLISNPAMAGLHLSALLIFGLRARRLDVGKWTPREKKEELFFTAITLPVSLGLIVCQFAFACGYLNGYGFFLFYIGLIYLLLLSALHFVLLLIPDR
jgi:hypothetical protein